MDGRQGEKYVANGLQANQQNIFNFAQGAILYQNPRDDWPEQVYSGAAGPDFQPPTPADRRRIPIERDL